MACLPSDESTALLNLVPSANLLRMHSVSLFMSLKLNNFGPVCTFEGHDFFDLGSESF